MKKCPFCAEEIQDEAIKCRYCGSDLTTAPPTPPSPTVPPVVPPVSSTPPATPPPAATQPIVPPAVPPVVPPSVNETASPASRNLAIWVVAALIAVILAIGVVLIVALSGGDETPPQVASPFPTLAVPTLAPPTALPTTLPSPIDTGTLNTPPISKAHVDGLYDGPKYDFAMKAGCKSGPCGGVAQSGAQVRIHYGGHGTYHGTTVIKQQCADGGLSLTLPTHVALSFRPVNAKLVGDEWIATDLDMNIQFTRKAAKKSVRISSTTIRTLTCKALHDSDNFTARLVGV